jgi:hypothetical protein
MCATPKEEDYKTMPILFRPKSGSFYDAERERGKYFLILSFTVVY